MIVIAATFVAEPLQLPLEWLITASGVNDEIRFAPYNQIFQQLLSPTSDLRRDADGLKVLLVRFEDFLRDLPRTSVSAATVRQIAAELTAAFEAFANHATGPTIVVMMSPGPDVSTECTQAIRECNDAFAKRFRDLTGVQLLEEVDIQAVSTADQYDPVRDRLAHIPFTESYFAALALAIARRIHAVRTVPAKVLVLDCDNTLWKGVVGEDGIDGIEISESFASLQEFAVEQHAKGVLICLVSKNVESDVLEVLERHPDMRLRKSHTVAHRINWEPKAANMCSLAAELNLGLDAFVFLDDNPVECAQMHEELPQVVTIQLPRESEIPQFLRRLWVLDKLTITSEDANRTRMYRENAARRALEISSGDIGGFLASLNLKVDIAAPSEEEWPRVAQLTQRTNQFNFTTRRRSAPELKSLIEEGGLVLRVRVADRFGDYGTVGIIIAAPDGAELAVDSFLLSCRVLGRGVEHAMLRRLGELAQDAGLKDVVLPYVATTRNVPARAFAQSVASEYAQLSPEGSLYRIPAMQAARIVHRPGYDPVEIIEARISEEKKNLGAAKAAFDSGRSERYSRLAHLLTSGDAVLEQMSARPRLQRPLAAPALPPVSRLEIELLALWEELLNINGLGVEDDFFDLGGSSLLSVRLFAEIARRYGVQLKLTAIVEAPTVRGLATLMARSGESHEGGIVCLQRGGTRNVFLVHDGLGETLLYLNLARRLPHPVSVYGIEPKRLPGIPLAHATMEDMAAHYVEQIRRIQPNGPYILGGMCAGGVIAYEMATRLAESGERVQAVIILDGSTPQAVRRGGGGRHRLARLREALMQVPVDQPPAHRWLHASSTALRKAGRVIAYETSSRAHRIWVRSRFLLLKYLIRRNAAWPAALPELSVLEIYGVMESRYRPRVLKDVPILLVRASTGVGLDTPHRQVYRDEHLGWGEVAEKLELVDVNGGHSSMLQEHEVESLASAIVERVPALAGLPPKPEFEIVRYARLRAGAGSTIVDGYEVRSCRRTNWVAGLERASGTRTARVTVQ